MALLRPFKGIRYNPSRIKDLSRVICPPYDVISQVQQEYYYNKSSYNFIRLEYSKEFPGDGDEDNKYTRALNTLEKWLSEGILFRESMPAIYVHDHHFELNGTTRVRRGIICTVLVEDWSKMVIRPHEGTLPRARSDREILLRTLEANTSPVFVMYEDYQKAVSSILENITSNDPQLDIDDYDGEHHRLWVVTEPRILEALTCIFETRPLYIADGHHRYESALKYKRECDAIKGDGTGDEPYNFIMMEMADFKDPGLVILPPHRLIRGVSRSRINFMISEIRRYFDVTEFDSSTDDAWTRIERHMKASGSTTIALVLSGEKTVYVLAVKDQASLNVMMPAFHSPLYRQLDVSIVDHVILEGLLGLSDMSDMSRISFNHDRQEALQLVGSGIYQLAVILPAMKPSVIKKVADAGERMPRKSTYFHPKLPSGLVVNRLK